MATCVSCDKPATMAGQLNGRPIAVCSDCAPGLVLWASRTSHALRLMENPNMNENTLTQPAAGPMIDATALPEEQAREIAVISQRFQLSKMIAAGMAQASLLPEHLRTKKVDGAYVDLAPAEIEANCILICNQAFRWGVDPFALAPESYVVGGKLAYQGKLVTAIINKLAGLRESLRFDFQGSGEDLTVTVTGHLKSEQTPRTVTLSVAQARTDNDIWDKDPEQKLVYSGAIRWARRHKPETLLGITDDSAEDQAQVETVPAVSGPAKPRESLVGLMQEVNAAESREELERVVARVKASGLMPNEIQGLVARAKTRWAELDKPAQKEPQDADSADHPFHRWDRTIRTSPLDQLPQIRAQILQDAGLAEPEAHELIDLIDQQLGQYQNAAAE